MMPSRFSRHMAFLIPSVTPFPFIFRQNELVADLGGLNHFYDNRGNYLIEEAGLEAKFTFVDKFSLSFGYMVTEIHEKVEEGAVVVEEIKSCRLLGNTLSMLYMKNFDGGYNANAAYYFVNCVQGWKPHSEDKVREPARQLNLKVTQQCILSDHEAEMVLVFRDMLGEYEEMEILRLRADFPELNEVDSSGYLMLKANI